MMNKIKNPPKGGDDSKWVFKKCRFQKTIIKKGKYKKLPNGDIVITEHEGMIGFKKKKKRTGGNGGSKAPKWFQAYEEREQQRWARQEEFNEWVKNIFKFNNLKDPSENK